MIDRDKIIEELDQLEEQYRVILRRKRILREAIRCEDDKLAELFLHPQATLENIYGTFTRLYQLCEGCLFGLKIGDTVHVIDKNKDNKNILKLTLNIDEFYNLMS